MFFLPTDYIIFHNPIYSVVIFEFNHKYHFYHYCLHYRIPVLSLLVMPITSYIIAPLLPDLSTGTKTKLLCNSFKLAMPSQSLSVNFSLLGIILFLIFFFLSSIAEICQFFHSRKLQMLMPLLEESSPIYSYKPMKISILASCQGILTGSLHLGSLETSFFNLPLDIIPRSPLKAQFFWIFHKRCNIQALVHCNCRLSKCVNYYENTILFNEIRMTGKNFLTM